MRLSAPVLGACDSLQRHSSSTPACLPACVTQTHYCPADAAQKDLVDAHAPQDAAEVFETPNDAGQADQQPRLPHSNNSTATGHSPQASQEQSQVRADLVRVLASKLVLISHSHVQGGGVLGMLGRALWGSRSTPPAQEGEHDTTDTAVSKEAPGYVPGDDTGRELLADTATSESPGKTGGEPAHVHDAPSML